MDALTVVIVDDDADIRSALGEALETEGYAVRLATNGVEAIEAVAELGIERCVVLLDLCMPTMSGEEVLDVLRNEGQLPALPVIVLSATKPAFAATAGARLCLNKPLDLDVLLRVLEHLCGELSDASTEVSYSRLRTTLDAGTPALAKCASGASAEEQTKWRVRRVR